MRGKPIKSELMSDILTMLAYNMSTKDIGKELNISHRTVEGIRSRNYDKIRNVKSVIHQIRKEKFLSFIQKQKPN